MKSDSRIVIRIWIYGGCCHLYLEAVVAAAEAAAWFEGQGSSATAAEASDAAAADATDATGRGDQEISI